jgi:hypothetical protein
MATTAAAVLELGELGVAVHGAGGGRTAPSTLVHSPLALCALEHATEQYSARQAGHRYFESTALQITHSFMALFRIASSQHRPQDSRSC